MVETHRRGETPCSEDCAPCTRCTLHTQEAACAVLATGHSIPAVLDTDATRQKAVEAAVRQEVLG